MTPDELEETPEFRRQLEDFRAKKAARGQPTPASADPARTKALREQGAQIKAQKDAARAQQRAASGPNDRRRRGGEPRRER